MGQSLRCSVLVLSYNVMDLGLFGLLIHCCVCMFIPLFICANSSTSGHYRERLRRMDELDVGRVQLWIITTVSEIILPNRAR